MERKQENTSGQNRYSYKDCLRGNFEHPRSRSESLLFDVLFVVGMATTMVFFVNFAILPVVEGAEPTFSRFIGTLEMLPGLCVAALCLRLIYADRLSELIRRKLVAPRFSGMAASVLMSSVNVTLMAPFMCIFAVLLAGAPPIAIIHAFGTVFPYAAFGGFALSMAGIRPLVMMVFSNVVVPRYRRSRQKTANL